MDTVFCPICGKEYKDVKMHIRKGHDRDPEEVIEEAFGQKLSSKERQQGTAQKLRARKTMNRINNRTSELQREQTDKINEMQETWRNRQEEFQRVMKKRIKNIINK